MLEQTQPYVGPRAFKPEDAPFFFGRDREANELLSLVISHAEVLLYAQSGAGKTSLINAKLLILLENEGLDVLPLARVQGPPSTISQSQIANVYVFNTLLEWTKGAVAPEKLAKMTLREFLEQREQPIDKEGLPKPCVAIFDQFEELFSFYPEHWEQRRGFFEQVRDALDANPRLRALFAMREDYVAGIDRYARIMPEEFRIRFHLENLREPQALEAIEGPLKQDQRRHFAPHVAAKLVKELMKVQVETESGRTEAITGEFVEPVQLQVVCERLWRDLKPEETEITFKDLEAISVEKALLSFYEESIQTVAQQTHLPEPVLRSWFERHLVTPAGTRGMVFRGETETEGLPNDAVDALDKLHIIRSERRGGSQWYELTHDRFIDSVRRSHEKVLSNLQAGAAEVGQRLEKKAAAWEASGRTKTGLLAENELLEAQHWLKSPEAAALGFPEKVMTLVEASRAEAQARSARRRKVLTYALGTLCLIALVAFGIALWQSQRATAEGLRAKEQTKVAVRETAESNHLRAESEVDRNIILGRNLAARSAKYRGSDLGLALLLNLEANRIADEIKPQTPSQVEAKASLVAEAKGGFLDGLVSSPHLRRFLHGHTKTVRSVAFSPDGKILASGGYDGDVILWDVSGYPLGPPLSGHDKGKAIFSVAFSPDGKKVASCGADGKIILWDVENPKNFKPLLLDHGELDVVAFSPDGNTLACGTEDGTVVLLDVEGGGVMNMPRRHKGRVYSVAFSPNPKTKKFASSGEDRKIIFWDFNRRQPDGVVDDTYEVFSVAFSPDGNMLASGNRGSEVELWNVTKRKRLGQPLPGHTDPVFSVAFSPDGATLVSGSTDMTIRRWNVAKRQPIGEPLTGSSKPVYSVAFNPDGKTLASGADLGVTVLWDITHQSLLSQSSNLRSIYRVALTPDGKTLAAGDLEGNITMLSANVDETFHAHQQKVTSVAFSRDGATLASASTDGSIQLRSWNGKTWNSSPKALGKALKSVNSVAFNPKDNRILVSGDDNGDIIFWDVTSVSEVGKLPKQEDTVNSVAFSPDGKTLASGSDDNTVVLWNVATRQQLNLPFKGHHDSVFSVAFNPDGTLLASGSGGHDAAVILWDVLTGQPRDVFRQHTGSVRGVAFSPDGKTLASCSDDKSIILWDVAAHESIGPLMTEDQDSLYAVSFSPDGQLVSAGSDVTYWDIRLEALRSNAEEVAGRNLSHDEWKRFLAERSYRQTSPYASLKEADMFALEGEVEKARKAFEEVVGMAIKSGDVELNNGIGWYGSLDKCADIVLPACDHAIALAKDKNKPYFRDSRGLARALTGRFAEATEDFRAFVTWLKIEEENEEKAAQHSSSEAEKAEHQRIAAQWETIREKREEWIAKLESSQTPFNNDEILKALRKEQAPTSPHQ